MALPSVYSQANGQIPDFFKKIQDGQAPSIFTQQYLKDIGFTSTSHRAFIPILKALGFLSSTGSPTSKYLAYRDKSQAKRVMGSALKEAYSDLFTIKSNPSEADKDLIEGKFKSVHNCSDRVASLMTRTFLGLLSLAHISHSNEADSVNVEHTPKSIEKENKGGDEADKLSLTYSAKVNPSLHYNIQIHLPATKDIEVYNSIFKSLKEHLID
ncbi:DUF5343 domain-containing protein [Hahella sp. NBU794]|uniref:DUF5343 domain-containing protein n=1 Tax=Hahella sp. NBU794 TaxID=3422590 RepID=UPI003D6E325D